MLRNFQLRIHILFAPQYDKMRMIDGFRHTLTHGALHTFPASDWVLVSQSPKRLVPSMFEAVFFGNLQIPIAFAYDLVVSEKAMSVVKPHVLHCSRIENAKIYSWNDEYTESLLSEIPSGGDFKDIVMRFSRRLSVDKELGKKLGHQYLLATADNASAPECNLAEPLQRYTLECLCELSPSDSMEWELRDVPRRNRVVLLSEEWMARYPIQQVDRRTLLLSDTMMSSLEGEFVCPWWRRYSCTL